MHIAGSDLIKLELHVASSISEEDVVRNLILIAINNAIAAIANRMIFKVFDGAIFATSALTQIFVTITYCHRYLRFFLREACPLTILNCESCTKTTTTEIAHVLLKSILFILISSFDVG